MAAQAAILILSLLAGSAIAALLIAGKGSGFSVYLPQVARVALFTVKQALLSTLLSLAFALPAAVALQSLHAFRGRRFVLALFAAPLSLPAIAAVLATLSLYGRNGAVADLLNWAGFSYRPDIYGLSGILIVHVFFNMPLGVRMLLQAFDEIPSDQWRLAEILRFNATARIRHLAAPAAWAVLPGIAGLIFLICAGSYTIVLVLGGGPAATTIQVAIQQALSFDFDLGKASILTLAQLALTGLLLWLLPAKGVAVQRSGQGDERRFHRASNVETFIATAILVMATGFVVAPLVALMIDGLPAQHLRLLTSATLFRAIGTSALIALAASFLAVLFAYGLAAGAYALRQQGHVYRAGLIDRFATAMLGLPPLVLGVGWFALLVSAGQPFALAPVLIVLANAIMALPFALQMIQPALERHFSASDRLAAIVRLGGWQRFRLVDWPVLKPALFSGLFFAAALSFGDLGVVTLYGSDRILTLPALIYQSLGSYRTDDAAGLVLYLVIITGFLSLLATERVRHER